MEYSEIEIGKSYKGEHGEIIEILAKDDETRNIWCKCKKANENVVFTYFESRLKYFEEIEDPICVEGERIMYDFISENGDRYFFYGINQIKYTDILYNHKYLRAVTAYDTKRNMLPVNFTPFRIAKDSKIVYDKIGLEN